MIRYGIFLLLALTAWPAIAAAEQAEYPDPLQFMERETAALLAIVKSRDPRDPQSVTDTRRKLRDNLFRIFDGPRVSSLALGREIRALSDDQFNRFTAEFSELLYLTYLDRIESYSSEQFIYESFSKPEDHKTTVRGKVKTAKDDYLFEYQLILNNGEWKIYNIKVEGVSLIQNYRTQFREYLIKHTPDELIERVREKIDEYSKTLRATAAP